MKPSIPRKARTLNLGQSVNDKMEAVAKAYDISCNAYLLMRLGEVINRDYLSLQTGTAISLFGSLAESEEFKNFVDSEVKSDSK